MTSGNGASIGVGGQQKPSAFLPRDPDAVRTHVEMLHQLAAPLTGRRKLIVATYGEDPLKGKEIVSKVCQFPIGDVEPMVKAIINLNTERHRNVYCPWAVMRKDLPSGKKGSEQDIVWLMGLVSDFDDDDAANWSHRLPCPPNYVLETSAGRFQTFYIVDKPSSVTGAKRVAEKLKAFAHCDHGSADLSHVWRVPGTLNWPNAKKVKEGRPREPQVVRVLQPWDGALTRFARLADFVDLIPEPPNGGLGFKPPNGHAPNPDRGEPQQGIAEIIGKLPKWLLGRLKKNGEGVDRSKELFSVIAKLCELGHDDTTITKILAEFPDGIVAKYRNRAADLNKEITRIREKSQKKTTEPEGDYIENDKGKRLACLANAIIALRTSPEWQTKLRYDLFAERLLYGSKPWETINDIFLAEWLQHRGIMVSPQIAGQAAYAVGFNNQFHPVRDYLEGLSWDQTERLDNWLRAYFGVKCSVVEPGNDETVQRVIAEQGYHAAVGAKFLIGMVARVMRPGCKFDCAYVLEGEQGALKSTALRELMPCEDWFTDELADLGSKDAALQLAGRWLVEWSELDTYVRSEISRLKAYMSRQADKFRPPYGAHVITRPRQCGFAGSTNHSEYLRDETGGRRFWPWRCWKIDVAAIRRDRDQLWAEALHRFKKHEKWWLDAAAEKQAKVEQEARRIQDPWEDRIAAKLKDLDPKYITRRMVLEDILFLEARFQDQRAANRVASCLRALGWTRNQLGKDVMVTLGTEVRTLKRREWVYSIQEGDDTGYAGDSGYKNQQPNQ